MFLASHYRGNAQHLTVVGPGVDSLTSKAGFGTVIMGFLEVLKSHGYVLQSHGYVLLGIYSELKSLAPKITQMSVTEILMVFGALLADGMLISIQAVVDALLDTLVSIGTLSWTSPATLRPASATS
ncbi:hypothetical protein PG990_002282 [Apiospora arundinis]